MAQPQSETQTSLADALNRLSTCVRIQALRSSLDLEAVFRLRHDCYADEGAIVPRTDRRLTDRFDDAANTTIYGVFEGDTLVASIRLHVLSLSHAESPTALAFPDIVQPLISTGATALDPTRFVVDGEASRRLTGLAYYVLRIPFMAAEHFRISVALASVRSEHMAFYRRALHYRTVATPRPYLQLTKPLGLMQAEFWQERPSVLSRYPFFAGKVGEAEALFEAECANA